jgi:signal transduction histidine kinase
VQVLDNLVSNAVKYSPAGTTIVISASQADGKVTVAVKDQGPGLSEEDQKKLFQKFTRLTARPTGGESSNGLGLSIVKRLAEAMNGNVGCHSVLGQGATFFVQLPVAA